MEGEGDHIQSTVTPDDFEILRWSNPHVKFTSDERESKKTAVEGSDVYSDEKDDEESPFSIELPAEEDVEEVLKTIFPPREWIENGTNWIQYISKEPYGRTEAHLLSEKVKRVLKCIGARERGLCSLRRAVYDQLLDEMVRQMTARSVERGLLLLKVRDDMRMTIDTYKTLAESAVSLGKEKAIEAEEGSPEIISEIEELKKLKAEKESDLHILEKQHAAKERVFKEWKDREVAKHKRKIDFLKATNEGIQTQWDLITAWKPQNIEMGKYLFEEDN